MTDQHNDLQLDKHLEGDNSELSSCCEAEIIKDEDEVQICSNCFDLCIPSFQEWWNLKCSADDDRIEEMKGR